jgi:Uma2 family endonuclease
MAVATRSTVEDLLATPDDGNRHELLRGEIIVSPPPGYLHSKRSTRFTAILVRFADESGLGTVLAETGFLLQRDPETVLGPDIVFIRADRLPVDAEETTYLELAPDLVVEVVSPSNSASEMHDKVLTYLEAGVRLVLVLEPKRRTVTVHTPDRVARTLVVGETLNGGDVLPGFSVPVADLFA